MKSIDRDMIIDALLSTKPSKDIKLMLERAGLGKTDDGGVFEWDRNVVHSLNPTDLIYAIYIRRIKEGNSERQRKGRDARYSG